MICEFTNKMNKYLDWTFDYGCTLENEVTLYDFIFTIIATIFVTIFVVWWWKPIKYIVEKEDNVTFKCSKGK